MRTKPLPGAATPFPWLTRETAGQPPQRIDLDDFPFVLGRNESCDFQVLSSRVSREHCEIVRDGAHFKLRDLGSTNGTFVNGQRIDEVRLRDGDLVVIADVEFCFGSSEEAQARRTVTQPMAAGDTGDANEPDEDHAGRDFVQAVRALHESLLSRAVRNRFQPIVELDGHRCVGYEAQFRPQSTEPVPAQRLLAATDCRLTERMAQLHRLVAAEHVAKLPVGTLLFVNLQPAEVGADALPDSLLRLARLAGGRPIVAEIPDSAVVDIPYFRDFRDRLRSLGIAVAYDAFAGSPHQIAAQAAFAPDYLKLASVLVRGVDRSTQRQEQIRALVAAARESKIELIAGGVHTDSEAQTCRELGCRLGQGDHFGRAQTIDWPIEA
ncbi:MAG: EAL domain-containing protein [Pirellulaceae bacterium]|nr:EAL domain-containing protein [Pirellulaceae bacterium]